MFSLVISIVSIALVAALALATLFYGGSAFNEGQAKAKAATITNQTQQLLGATQLFIANNGRVMNNMQELLDSGYLKAVPMAQGAVANAWADSSWRLAAPGRAVFVLDTPERDVCRYVNEKSYGLDGILPTAREGVTIQCFGEQVQALRTVASLNGVQLRAAADDAVELESSDVVATPIPSGADTPFWYVPPGSNGSTTPPVDPGEPQAPEFVLQASTSNLAFGSNSFEGAGVSIGTRTFTLSNTGDAAGAVGGFSSPSHFQATHNCATLAVGASCEVTVNYAPLAQGTHAGNLEYAYGSRTISVGLSAEATAAPQSLQLYNGTPGAGGVPFGGVHSFGNKHLGEHTSLILFAYNTGSVPVSLGASNFELSSNWASLTPHQRQLMETRLGDCSNIAPGGYCRVQTFYQPQGSTPSSTMTWTATTNEGQTVSLSMQANVLMPNATVDVTSVNFVGESPYRTIIVSNTGQGNLFLTGFNEYLFYSGYESRAGQGFMAIDDRFTVTGESCLNGGEVILPGQSCAFTIGAYAGYGAGVFNETFRITPDFGPPAISIPVTYTSPY